MKRLEALSVSASSDRLAGSVPVPSDEGIALCRLAVALLSRGESRVNCREPGSQTLTFLRFCAALGGSFEWVGEDVVLRGLGLGLWEFADDLCLDLRGEVMVAGLAIGLLAGRTRAITVLCDDAVRGTLGARLEQMGIAVLSSTKDGSGVHLSALPERPPGFNAELTGLCPWEKQALLLIALRSQSPSRIIEGILSPDHLERVLFRSRAPIRAESTLIEVHPPRDEDALAPSSYEFVGSHYVGSHLLLLPFLAPAGGQITVREMAANRSSVELPILLRSLGAEVYVEPRGDRQGEPFADFTVLARGPLRGGATLAGEQVARTKDLALPLLAALGRAPRPSMISEIAVALRDANANVVPRAAAYVVSSGLPLQFQGEGVVVGGGSVSTRGLRVTTGGDFRLALLGALLACSSTEESVIDDVGCLASIFPRCAGTLRRLGVKAQVRAAEE